MEGYQNAVEHSRSGDVIIEQYLPYDEINLTYIAQAGDIQLAAIHDRYLNTTQKVLQKHLIYIYIHLVIQIFLLRNIMT